MSSDIEAMVKTTLQTQILKAFKDAPEAIDAMVKAALEQEVNSYGGKPDYHDRVKMPYLEWIVGDTIRRAAREAVIQAVEERKAEINAAVRKAIKADSLVDALTQSILGTLDEEYKVTITFADEKRRD